MNIQKFTQKSVEAINNCEKLAYDYGNQEIEQEHLLVALLQQEEGLIPKLIEKMEIDVQHFTQNAISKLDARVKVSGSNSNVYVGKDLNNVLFQCIICCFRIIGSDTLIAADGRQCLQKPFPCQPIFFHQCFHRWIWIFEHCKENMLDRDIFISHCLGFILCTDQSLVQVLSETELTTGYLNSGIQCLIQRISEIVLIYLHLLNQFKNQAVFLFQQSI